MPKHEDSHPGAPAGERKVIPIAEAARRRRLRNLRELADAVEGAADDEADAAGHFAIVGNMDLLEGQFEGAIEAFSRALSLAPDDPSALAGRGRAYQSIGEHALALADFDRAVALVPDQPQHHLGRAKALGLLGRLSEAVAACSRAISIAPDSAGAHYLRAVYRSNLDADDPRVRADLDRTVELAPNEVPYLRQRAEYLIDLRELDLALVDIDRALALAPDDSMLHYHRGYCSSNLVHARWERGVDESETEEHQKARCETALASLERAIELGLQNEDVYFELVCVREEMGDEDAHLAALDRALAAFPDEIPLRLVRWDRRRRRGDLEGADDDERRLRELGFEGELPGCRAT
jgi:tetratricopeptide (TPR) repeat protein